MIRALSIGLAALCALRTLDSRSVRQASGAIRVRNLGLVSADVPDLNHAEPWLAIDPRNPARALAVAIADPGERSVAYRTVDGGVTWKRSPQDGAGTQLFSGLDPVVAFDDEGTALVATVSPFRVWQSRDGGETWSEPTIVPGRSYDREYIVVKAVPNGPDTIFVLAKTPIRVFGHVANDALAFSRSTDGGATFEYPRLLLADPSTSIIHVAGGFVVAPNGDIIISFLAHDAPVADPVLIKNRIWITRSKDGGRTFSEPIAATTSIVHGNRGDELKMLKSLATAGIAMDTAQGSAYRGRLYLNYLTVLDGRLQVMVATSSDTGRTWSSAVKVNDDAGTANHSNPRIAINQQGIVGVIWNDRRSDPKDLCFRPMVSASFDGGKTFAPNVALTSTSSCPLGADSSRASGFNRRYMQGGETQGFAPLPDGRFLAVFVGGRTAMQLHAATIEATAQTRP